MTPELMVLLIYVGVVLMNMVLRYCRLLLVEIRECMYYDTAMTIRNLENCVHEFFNDGDTDDLASDSFFRFVYILLAFIFFPYEVIYFFICLFKVFALRFSKAKVGGYSISNYINICILKFLKLFGISVNYGDSR